jgi:hypothetical protein
MKHFYVYAIVDPRPVEVFYIGMGQGSRLTSTLNDKHNREKFNIINDIRKSGYEPEIHILAAHLTKKDAQMLEAQCIEALGTRKAGNGILTNRKRGGVHVRQQLMDA